MTYKLPEGELFSEDVLDRGVPLDAGVEPRRFGAKVARAWLTPSGRKNCSLSSVLVLPLAEICAYP